MQRVVNVPFKGKEMTGCRRKAYRENATGEDYKCCLRCERPTRMSCLPLITPSLFQRGCSRKRLCALRSAHCPNITLPPPQRNHVLRLVKACRLTQLQPFIALQQALEISPVY